MSRYERLLLNAEAELAAPLNAEPQLLSTLIEACSAAGWERHALAANASLCEGGLQPTPAALNALAECRLRAGESDYEPSLSRFVTLSHNGPVLSHLASPPVLSHFRSSPACHTSDLVPSRPVLSHFPTSSRLSHANSFSLR